MVCYRLRRGWTLYDILTAIAAMADGLLPPALGGLPIYNYCHRSYGRWFATAFDWVEFRIRLTAIAA